ncbi:MAG: TIGR01777 family oxidoreductase [Bacteroidia bacterium]|jgi:uncharacterized protein (TIGR01777 family)
MKTVLITGASGAIAHALSKELKNRGFVVYGLSRSAQTPPFFDAVFSWDIEAGSIDWEPQKSPDVVIHLAGSGIADKPWTAERKKEILHSRIKSLDLLKMFFEKRGYRIEVLVSGSAVGWYGMQTDEIVHTETEPAATDFLGQTCLEWEAAADRWKSMADRIVKIRTGIVLDAQSGALPRLITPAKCYVAGYLGTGKQQMPWIHINDLCSIFAAAIEEKTWQGPINAVATENCSNKEFTAELCRVLKRPFIPFGVPSLTLKLILGERAALVLEGSRISNKKLLQLGFNFYFNTLKEALSDLLELEAYKKQPPVGKP